MPKLPRITQKVFCGNAQQTETAIFGTMKTGSGTYTSNVSELMSSDSWGLGFTDAVIANYAPFLEETNGLFKVLSQQIAYGFQSGIAEYDSGTTYYEGSWVKAQDGSGNYTIFESVIDNNTGQSLTDQSKWEQKSFGGTITYWE